MAHFDALFALFVYLAILAVAVAWFLFPRWWYGPKGLMVEQMRLEREAWRAETWGGMQADGQAGDAGQPSGKRAKRPRIPRAQGVYADPPLPRL